MGIYLSVLFLGLGLVSWALIGAGALMVIALVCLIVKRCSKTRKHKESAALAEAASRTSDLTFPGFPEEPLPGTKEEPSCTAPDRQEISEAHQNYWRQWPKYVQLRSDAVNEGDEPMKIYVPVQNEEPIRRYIEVHPVRSSHRIDVTENIPFRDCRGKDTE